MATRMTSVQKQMVTALAVSALWLLPGLLGPAWAQEAERAARTLTVTGEGQVSATPDMAVISVGIGARAEAARDALAETSAIMEEMIAALRGAGVAPVDMQTSGLSLQPLRKYDSSSRSDGPPEGFQALNRLTVRVRNIAETGAILDVLVGETGANRIDGVQFTLRAPDPLRDQARQRAVQDARRKAELYAQAAGVRLGPLMSLSEQGGGRPMPIADARFAEARSAVPVEQGELVISQSVMMVWALE